MYIFIWELLKRDQELHPCGVLKQNIITVTNESNVKTYNWVGIGQSGLFVRSAKFEDCVR